MGYKITTTCDVCGKKTDLPTATLGEMINAVYGFVKLIAHSQEAGAPNETPIKSKCHDCPAPEGLVVIGQGAAVELDAKDKPS